MAEEWLECQKRIDAYVDEQVGVHRWDGRKEPAARRHVPRGGVRAGAPSCCCSGGDAQPCPQGQLPVRSLLAWVQPQSRAQAAAQTRCCRRGPLRPLETAEPCRVRTRLLNAGHT